MKTLVHLTSVHPRRDIRIFFRQCISFTKFGYKTILIVADGLGDEIINDIQIFDVGHTSNRFKRIIQVPKLILNKAKNIEANIYILHDPELLTIVSKLKNNHNKVYFDSHEDYQKQFLDKYYLKFPFNYILSHLYSLYEQIILAKIDGVIAATSHIYSKFTKKGFNSVIINNYPLLDEVSIIHDDLLFENNDMIYIGIISKERGIIEIINSLSYLKDFNVKLNLCGDFSDSKTEKICRQLSNWELVNYHGTLNRDDLFKIMKKSILGLVTFHPTPNHINAQPNKLFEYMSVGLPVLASNFPNWNKIIIDNKCGVTVNPYSSQEIANAILSLIKNKKSMIDMGRNGKKLILNYLNWNHEEVKLKDFVSYDN